MKEGRNYLNAGSSWAATALVLIGWAVIFAFSPILAADRVDIDVDALTGDDTLRVGFTSELKIFLENDYLLGGMSLGFRVYSPDGAYWQWIDVGGYGASGCVTVVDEGRLYPPEDVFNLTGLIVTEHDLDGISPDMIMCGGVGTEAGGLPIGPLDHLYSKWLTPMMDNFDIPIRTLCVDSAFIPPSGAFVFVDVYGSASTPTVLWPYGGRCYILGWCRCSPPNWDADLPTEMAVVYGTTGSVILSAFDPGEDSVIFGNLELTGGGGEAVLDDHGDGTCEVFYTPVVEDAGQEITISVGIRDYNHHFGARLPHVIDVEVSYNPLSIDCGWWYENGATNNPIVKSDVYVPDGHLFENLVFSLVSGQGEVDPETGEYSWTPGPSDIGVFEVVIGVTDGTFYAECSFQIDVVDENCCPGDANFSGGVNVGDAVMLINFIFKGGAAPKVMNWADPNADCEVNVGDVVFLINYVFRSGLEPQLGCVY